jgi:HD superfamily phosphodiesterase
MEWVERFATPEDAVAKDLLPYFAEKEREFKGHAQTALAVFDREQWKTLAEKLEGRATAVPLEGSVFEHLAVERLEEAHNLHRRALKNRTQVSFHQLRIGVKRFRYTVENFLPRRHEEWSKDLREIQDLLGDVHDLDVLWGILRTRTKLSLEDLTRWRQRITGERQERLASYRRKMIGPQSLWTVWRADLPNNDHLERAALQRMSTWAAFLDPDVEHSKLVALLSLQLYDGLVRDGILRPNDGSRRLLEAAAVLHDVGRSRKDRGHHKQSCRLIQKLTPPMGWTPEEMRAVAAIARYHRGALPRPEHRCLAQVPGVMRPSIVRLAAVVRLAHALDLLHERQVRQVQVARQFGAVVLRCDGYSENGPLAEPVAAARHLLEVGCRMPVLVRSAPSPA